VPKSSFLSPQTNKAAAKMRTYIKAKAMLLTAELFAVWTP